MGSGPDKNDQLTAPPLVGKLEEMPTLVRIVTYLIGPKITRLALAGTISLAGTLLGGLGLIFGLLLIRLA